ncbi:MAG: DNA polymerase III subunit gamma/tau [Candidatus Moraniibacteriota bacterium]|nr:MAG: DNA polymerase III subunit gamma/tau [Candidatus Moranbacteria bacterium]
MANIYQKYRPSSFSEVKGQVHIVKALSLAVQKNRIGHAYLFTGPRGTGKTSLARIFAKILNCHNPKNLEPCQECPSCKEINSGISLNVVEIDAASYTGVENIRELRKEMTIPPSGSLYRIYIIDEVHMLSKGASNALLKILEEPPKHIIFILATTELHKVLPTVRSRCQEFEFSRILTDIIVEKLSFIAKKENVSIEEEALRVIALLSEGGMRNAESLFSQIIPLGKKKSFTKEAIEEIFGISDFHIISDFAFALFFKSSAENLSLIDHLTKKGRDYEVFLKNLIYFFRQALHIKLGSQYIDPEYSPGTSYRECIDTIIKKTDIERLLEVIEILSIAQIKTKDSFLTQLPLEIASVKISSSNFSKETFEKEIPKENTSLPQQEKITKKIEDVKEIPKKEIPSEISTPSKNIITPKEIEKSKKEKHTDDSLEIKEELPKKLVFSLEKAHSVWSDFLLETKQQNISFSLLFSNTLPLRMEEKTLILTTPFALHRDKINDAKNRLTAEAILTKLAKLPAIILCLTDKESGYERLSKSDSEYKNTSKETLTDALEIFGGSLVETS